LSLEYNIDATQVFATGMSNGGFMSYKLACELTGKIAKIASVTGTMNPNMLSSCSPSASIPVMQIHGTLDPTVPYDGIPSAMIPIEDVVDYWVGHNNCDATPITTALPNLNLNDNSTVERIEYLNGDNGAEVIFYKVTGGGHTWPGAIIDIPSGNTNKDFNASSTIWEFFKGTTLLSVKDRIDNSDLKLFVQNEMLIVSLGENEKIESIRIANALGQEILQSVEKEIPLDGISKGLYYVLIDTPKGFISKAFLK
jgi:polyhydroxybutyrate depolymerase